MKPRLLLGCLLLAGLAQAQTPPAASYDRAAARAAFEQARGLFSSDIEASVLGLRTLIDKYPDFYDAHQYYILYRSVAATRSVPESERKAAAEAASAEVEALYLGWAAAQPNRAVYACALGTIYQYKDPDRAERYFRDAVRLDPTFGQAYDALALCAEIRGDLPGSLALHRKSVEVEPDNVTLWRHLVGSLRESDAEEAVALGLKMAERFPEDASGILGYLAMRSRDEAHSLRIYELLRERFPKAAARNLTGLFTLYLKSDRLRALDLARQMMPIVPDNKDWPLLASYAQALIDGDALLAAGKPAEALAVLGKVTLPRYGTDRRWLDLAKARATAVEQPAQAFDDLLMVVATKPNDDAVAELGRLGRSLGKDAVQVAREVRAKRESLARPAAPFSLVDYATGRPVRLEDYRGRPVLVNFWYPLCGPCRGEFPFLQSVVEKYRQRGFEILAINGHAPEDHLVLPLLKGWKLDFTPLKGTDDIVKDYKVRGFPANFLVDQQGRIVYEPPPVSTLTAQRELELQIEALLDASAQ